VSAPELIVFWAAAACLVWAMVEVALRLRRDASLRRGRTLVAAALAFACLVGLLASRSRAAGQAAIVTVFDATVLLSAVLVLLLLVLSPWLRGPALGVFLLPLTVTLLVLAAALPTETMALRSEVPYAATVGHVALTMAGIAALAVGGLCGTMYLAQRLRLRRGSTDRLSGRLPNLERLERWNRGAAALGFVLYSLGLGLGLGMMGLKGESLGLTFLDAKVISSLVVWAIFVLLVVLGLRPRFRGRPVAWLTIVAFTLMVLAAVGVGFLWPTGHMFGQAVSSAGHP